MIRPEWLSNAAALRPALRVATLRWFSGTAAALEQHGTDPKKNNKTSFGPGRGGISRGDSQWKIPGRTESQAGRASSDDLPTHALAHGGSTPKDEFSQFRASAMAWREHLSQQDAALRKHIIKTFSRNDKPQTETQHHMLTISGLSPALKTSDFSRLAGTDLSDWNKVVNEVRQERDQWTLEPLGVYRLSFASVVAATTFREKISRLHRLAHLKMHSATGLWTSAVPSHLRRGATDDELEDELSTFTLASGSQPPPQVTGSRVKGKFPWQRVVDSIIKESGQRGHPTPVLLDLQPASLTAEELLVFIKEDEAVRNQKWQVTKPYQLIRNLDEKLDELRRDSTRVPLAKDADYRRKLYGRFVIVLRDEDTAWRFVRSWNQRALVTGSEGYIRRTLVNASLIEL